MLGLCLVFSWLAADARAQVLFRVNAGGPAVLDTGLDWSEDRSAAQGTPSPYVNAAATGDRTFSTGATIDLGDSSLPPGLPQALMRSERWDPEALPDLEWDFPVASGRRVEVRLYFAENFFDRAVRVFDVDVEGQRMLEDFDIFVAAGAKNRAIMRSIIVTSDGNLDIDLRADPIAPLVNAIEILDAPPATIAFEQSTLAGTTGLNQPTSLQLGPDGRLYVAQLNGNIYAYTVQRSGPMDYRVTATEVIDEIRQIPNHDNETGAPNGVFGRRVMGLLVTGTAAEPVLYVTSSDARGLDPDTNSGMVSRLTRNGAGWQRLDLVRGLPRAWQGHATGGLQLDEASQILYIAQGGNTNLGAPSNSFRDVPEYALSAAVLAIDLAAIGETTYDLPTLDDDSRPGVVDANDPFGGNNGKNQAKWVPGGPVQVHAGGFRNVYDVLLTEAGRLYTSDNGPNSGFGDLPVGEGTPFCTIDPSEPGFTRQDNFHHISAAGYYGGHPNPARANTGLQWNFDGIAPVATARPQECNYLEPGVQDGALTLFGSSTNGLAEYTASNFGGAMAGDILLASFNNTVQRLRLSADGTSLLGPAEALQSNVGLQPLDITAQGDGEVFSGTFWVADIGTSEIYVFEPTDIGPCTGVDDPLLDEDGDGYDNADEIDNGTNPCLASEIPPDFDGDFESDLNDPDDDNDSVADTADPFAIDPLDGAGTLPPVFLEFDAAIPGTLLGLGFTGLMNNGNDNYADLFDPDNMTSGGAIGVVTVAAVPEGDALDGLNSQEYGFQIGVAADPGRTLLTARTRIRAPFAGVAPQDFQSLGLFLGSGDQDNYVRLAVSANGGAGGLELGAEINGFYVQQTVVPLTLGGIDHIDLYLTVGENAPDEVTATYSVSTGGVQGPLVSLGVGLPIPLSWLSPSLAVGILSTSRGPAPEFPATWDLLEVRPGLPGANQAPTAVADTLLTGRGWQQEVDVLANDSDPDDGLDPGSVQIVSSPIHGTAVPDPKTGRILYEHDGSAGASDTFSYQVSDFGGLPSNVATVQVTIADPVVRYRVNAGGPALAGGWSEDRSAAQGIPSPYVNAAATGDRTFTTGATILLTDPSLPAGTPQTMLRSERWDPAPLPTLQWNFPVQAGEPLEVRLYFSENFFDNPVRVFDVDVDGQRMLENFDVFVAAGGKHRGIMRSIRVTADGNLDIDLIADPIAPILNGIEILGVPDGGQPPSAVNDTATVVRDWSVEIDVLANDSDDLGAIDPSSVTIETSPIRGTVVVDPITGLVTYGHDGSAPNSDSFTYRVRDTQGNVSNVATVGLSVVDPVVRYRVNAGGPALAGGWSEDRSAAQGTPSPYVNAAATGDRTFATGATILLTDPSLPAGTPQIMLRSERWDPAAVPTLQWNFPVNAGEPLEVRLYFSENFFNNPVRVFDVDVDGQRMLENFDVFVAAGGKHRGIMRSIRVTGDGNLDIDLIADPIAPIIQGIEILGSP